jgi:hypothetical protein
MLSQVKIAIFENEYNNLKGIFDAFNLLHFGKKAEILVFENSQEIKDLNLLVDFNFILVDLDLSPKSVLDGYQIIYRLLKIGIEQNKIIVLTGHVNPVELLHERGLPQLNIIKKPLKLESLEKELLK